MTLTRSRPLHVKDPYIQMMVELVILVIIVIFDFILLRDIKERLLGKYSEEFKLVFNVLLLVMHVCAFFMKK